MGLSFFDRARPAATPFAHYRMLFPPVLFQGIPAKEVERTSRQRTAEEFECGLGHLRIVPKVGWQRIRHGK